MPGDAAQAAHTVSSGIVLQGYRGSSQLHDLPAGSSDERSMLSPLWLVAVTWVVSLAAAIPSECASAPAGAAGRSASVEVILLSYASSDRVLDVVQTLWR